MMKKNKYSAFPRSFWLFPLIITIILSIAFIFVILINENLLVIIGFLFFLFFFSFITGWNFQWIVFEDNRLVLKNLFFRRLKVIDYDDMEVEVVTFNSEIIDKDIYFRERHPVLWICIYSKKFNHRKYRFEGLNCFGRHRMQILFKQEIHDRLEEIVGEINFRVVSRKTDSPEKKKVNKVADDNPTIKKEKYFTLQKSEWIIPLISVFIILLFIIVLMFCLPSGTSDSLDLLDILV